MNGNNRLRERLRRGDRIDAIWFITPSPAFAEVARSFPLDVAVVDMEHGLIGIPDLVETLRILRGSPISVVVRIPSHDPTMVCRVLDCGADGVIVPRVDDAETAAEMAAAARFPPSGRRGLAIGAIRAADYGRDPAYRQNADEVLAIMQLESGVALDNALAIAAAPGVDMVFIGPGDLGGDLRLEGPDNHAALCERVDAALSSLTGAGFRVATVPHCGRGPAELYALGFSMVVHNSDVIIMQEGLARHCEGMASTRRHIGDRAEK